MIPLPALQIFHSQSLMYWNNLFKLITFLEFLATIRPGFYYYILEQLFLNIEQQEHYIAKFDVNTFR
jgi:hypothetical protein